MIRKAAQNDFEFICELYVHPQVNRFLLYETMGSAEFTPIFDKLLADDVLYVYEASGEPAGMFKLVRLEHRTSHIGYLGGLAIHPAFSGQGHGKILMQEILSLGKELGFVRIELGVSTINARAIRLYTNAGFESEGVRRKAIYLKSERLFLDDISMAYLYE
jgi:putative acetyltransferase